MCVGRNDLLLQYALGQLAHFKLAPLPFCERVTITTDLLFQAGVVFRELEQLVAAELDFKLPWVTPSLPV